MNIVLSYKIIVTVVSTRETYVYHLLFVLINYCLPPLFQLPAGMLVVMLHISIAQSFLLGFLVKLYVVLFTSREVHMLQPSSSSSIYHGYIVPKQQGCSACVLKTH